VVGLAAAVLLNAALCGTPAAAQTRAPPEATQHALDELANAIAQGRVTRTPTPSPTPMPSSTVTPRPTLVPTDTPTPGTPAQPTPPPMLVVRGPASAYVRPSPNDPDGTWLELALPQGRWAIQYDTGLCAPPAPWTDLWLAMDDQSNRPITVDR